MVYVMLSLPCHFSNFDIWRFTVFRKSNSYRATWRTTLFGNILQIQMPQSKFYVFWTISAPLDAKSTLLFHCTRIPTFLNCVACPRLANRLSSHSIECASTFHLHYARFIDRYLQFRCPTCYYVPSDGDWEPCAYRLRDTRCELRVCDNNSCGVYCDFCTRYFCYYHWTKTEHIVYEDTDYFCSTKCENEMEKLKSSN